jgi:hypothetical protein
VNRSFRFAVDCPIDHTPEFKCSLENIPSAEDFDADKVSFLTVCMIRSICDKLRDG